jgi:hypothetical protein
MNVACGKVRGEVESTSNSDGNLSERTGPGAPCPHFILFRMSRPRPTFASQTAIVW